MLGFISLLLILPIHAVEVIRDDVAMAAFEMVHKSFRAFLFDESHAESVRLLRKLHKEPPIFGETRVAIHAPSVSKYHGSLIPQTKWIGAPRRDLVDHKVVYYSRGMVLPPSARLAFISPLCTASIEPHLLASEKETFIVPYDPTTPLVRDFGMVSKDGLPRHGTHVVFDMDQGKIRRVDKVCK